MSTSHLTQFILKLNGDVPVFSHNTDYIKSKAPCLARSCVSLRHSRSSASSSNPGAGEVFL